MKVFCLLLATAIPLFAAGCQRPLHADSEVLNGAVPRCRVLLSDARTEYRETAKKECEAAQTPEQRKRSGGCAVLDYMRFCSAAVTAGHGLNEPPVDLVEK
ncbi:hypothetical protein M2650_10630 [Luteimonas sp. SX5]|uniref:Lipoprotein n=1 Tax=Luteimonas galliterrae TaxID=2940486 RepID=A0ABT0MJM0_9GAMM|nr:hypothetical protein [Luteimonas galliterrae]MCL1635084.1 hypothetical protein [Luteimonas galliterrae]